MQPREWRIQQKLTQLELAAQLSGLCREPVSNDQVSSIERGKLPSREICHAYFKLTDGHVGPNDFYGIDVAA
jgi:transcriptional regulator with XRE-family HTH domain